MSQSKTNIPFFYELGTFVIGLVLIASSCLKLHGQLLFYWADVDGSWITTGKLFWFAVSIFELILGTLLAFGKPNHATTITATSVFVVFCCVQLSYLFVNAQSCGCLGAVEVSPLPVLLFDIAAVAFLFSLSRNLIVNRENNSNLSAKIVGVAISVAVAVPIGFFALESQLDFSQIQELPLVIDQEYVESQPLRIGDRIEIRVKCANRSLKPFRIVGGEFT